MLRVLVTGSRGKSSVVRLLQAAFSACGLESRARITGVVPRELGPGGERLIERAAGGHVGEMRWWLRGLPSSTEAVILENSAIAPELQDLAGRWLDPDLTLFTSAVPDHQEAWGPGSKAAAAALADGVPAGGAVILPSALEEDTWLRGLFARRDCRPEFAPPLEVDADGYRAVNQGLALAAGRRLGLDEAVASKAMKALAPDGYDFRLARRDGADWALAFSANDITSTRSLFDDLGWNEAETRLIYNHRRDRPLRLKSYAAWLGKRPWREVLIVGDRPARCPGGARFWRLRGPGALLALGRPGDRLFGCGNIAGSPLDLYHEESNP